MALQRMILIWGNWGPYHYARFGALREAAAREGITATGIELYASSGVYEWKVDHRAGDGVEHFSLGGHESQFRPLRMQRELIPRLRQLDPQVALLPSYWPWSLFINAALRRRGCRIVMMNESHAGTERASGPRRRLKAAIVRRFHAGFVGGEPHREHFASHGLPREKIFPGYDAVDNDLFASGAKRARADAAGLRTRMNLPPAYFLSLGRMIPKKNLTRLVRAFAECDQSGAPTPVHLVFVGSGESEAELRETARERGLPVLDHTGNEPPVYAPGKPTVHFYGFRQIDENPLFYGLARAFILPSLYEEWGLVVNEAMAAGLPVVASRTLGCTPDLVADGVNGFTFPPEDTAALTRALEVLAREPERAARMGGASRERIAAWGLDTFAANALKSAQAALQA